MDNQESVKAFMEGFNQLDDKPFDVDNLSPKDLKNIKLRLTLTIEKVQELFSSFLDQSTFTNHFDPFFSLLKNKVVNIQEENVEIDKEYVANFLADLEYINYGTAVLLEIPLQKCFEEVHKSNMTKLINFTGSPIYREDGKILYDASYTPPDIKSILN